MTLFTKENIIEFGELLKEADSYRPLIKLAVGVLKSYGPELGEIPEALCSWVVENRINSIQQYEEAGFSRDDAIIMTLDDANRVAKRMKEWNETKNK